MFECSLYGTAKKKIPLVSERVFIEENIYKKGKKRIYIYKDIDDEVLEEFIIENIEKRDFYIIKEEFPAIQEKSEDKKRKYSSGNSESMQENGDRDSKKLSDDSTIDGKITKYKYILRESPDQNKQRRTIINKVTIGFIETKDSLEELMESLSFQKIAKNNLEMHYTNRNGCTVEFTRHLKYRDNKKNKCADDAYIYYLARLYSIVDDIKDIESLLVNEAIYFSDVKFVKPDTMLF